MNIKESFIDEIYQQISLDGLELITSTLCSPPGRKPKETLVKLSEYFNNKSEQEKEIIKEIIQFSINSTIFDMLCIFDGVTKLDENIEDIKLSVMMGNKEYLLNDIEQQYLHDLFNIKIGNVS